MKVYLDDVRPTPDGYIRVFWPEEAIELLRTGQVTEISLDHDLGFQGEKERNVIAGFKPPEMHVHSDNASGIDKMRSAIRQIYKLSEDAV